MSEREPVAALLRGINLGPHNRVSMPGIRSLLESAGFHEVRTHLQSGNLVVVPPAGDRPGPTSAIGKAIEEVIETGTGQSIPVMTRTREEMAAIVAANPFLAPGVNTTMLHTVFLASAPEPDKIAGLDPDRSPPDRFSVVGREIYVHYPGGSGRSKLNLGYFEKTLGVLGTARNWNTVTKLLDLLQG